MHISAQSALSVRFPPAALAAVCFLLSVDEAELPCCMGIGNSNELQVSAGDMSVDSVALKGQCDS